MNSNKVIKQLRRENQELLIECSALYRSLYSVLEYQLGVEKVVKIIRSNLKPYLVEVEQHQDEFDVPVRITPGLSKHQSLEKISTKSKLKRK